MPSCTRHTWASVCLHEQMCVCLLNECCLLFHLALMIPSWHRKINQSTNKQTDHTRQFILCASKCVYVCVFMLNIWCLLFHLALVIDSYTCMSSCTRHSWARVYLHQRMCVCLLHECSLLFHLVLMMDLCVVIHACLRALVIRVQACACASRRVHVC